MGGVDLAQLPVGAVVVEDGVGHRPQGREIFEEEVPVDGVVPAALPLKGEEAVDLVGLVGPHVVKEGRQHQIHLLAGERPSLLDEEEL